MDFNTLIVAITATLNVIGLVYAVFTYKNTFDPRLVLRYRNPKETNDVGVLRLENLGKSTAYHLWVITPKGLGFEEGSKYYRKRVEEYYRDCVEDFDDIIPAEIIMKSLFQNQVYDLNPGDYIEFPYWVKYKGGRGWFGHEQSADGFKKDSVFTIIYQVKFFNLFKKTKMLKLKANPNILNGFVYDQ